MCDAPNTGWYTSPRHLKMRRQHHDRDDRPTDVLRRLDQPLLVQTNICKNGKPHQQSSLGMSRALNIGLPTMIYPTTPTRLADSRCLGRFDGDIAQELSPIALQFSIQRAVRA